jgi:polysaccharide biosynthesis protein PslH
VRILVCASAAPIPPLNGFGLLLDHLVRELRTAHEVRLVAHLEPHRSAEPGHPDVQLVPSASTGRIRAVLGSPEVLLRSRPLADDRRAAELWPTIEGELSTFVPDVVHVMSGRLAALAGRLEGWPTVLGAVDARHLNVAARAEAASGLRRLALREQARRIRHLIRTEYPRFGHVTVVTAEDREALLRLDPTLAITAIPNGVDTDLYRPDPQTEPVVDQVVFTGTMDYAPNVTAAHSLAREVLPRVRRQHPRATLVLAGRQPAPGVRALASLPGVTVTGEVPDIRPWLVGSQVFAAPMTSGTGIKNKVLEAMACGLPCVASPLALQGLEVAADRQVVVADDVDATAAAIRRILDDPRRAERLGQEARRYVEEHHSWTRVGAEHLRLYDEVIRAAAAGSGPRDRAPVPSADSP